MVCLWSYTFHLRKSLAKTTTTTTTTTTTKLSIPRVPFFASPVKEWTLAGSPWLHGPLEQRSGGNCDNCELLFGMSSSRSQWPWPSALHHSADKTTRDQHNAPRGQKNAGTEYCELSDEDEVPARGSWPPCLGEPRGAQDKVQQRTMEQIADDVPMLTLLDSPMAVLARHDMPLADQVIEVPKISCLPRCARTVLYTPQTTEQLVEVPTIGSFSLLQLIMEQTVEQIIDIPVPGGSLHGLAVPGSSSSSAVSRDVRGEGGSRTFPQLNKVRHYLRTPGRHCLRTRAHGRQQLVTSLWRSRRRRRSPRRSLTMTLSTWSLMGAGGGLARQQYCWWLAAADGSQIGHTFWRPPWLIGRGPG